MLKPTLKPMLKPKEHTEKQYLSVTELNRQSKSVLEKSLGQVWVQGEISNLSIPGSGHWYFSLKDASAQISCAMFKGKNRLLGFTPEHGQQVLLRGKVTLYEERGNYQLIVDFMDKAGHGTLQQQFEALKAQLMADGLFDPDVKRPLPSSVNTIGLITSPTGAAIKDVLSVCKRRFPLTQFIIYPCQVQGKQAHLSIMDAINHANERNECDVLLITRGGGSLEDLWCFNEEALAHVIFNSELPTISAVGHEVDFTISDFVADIRAPTPSAAAELLTKHQDDVKQKVDRLSLQLNKAFQNTLSKRQHQLDKLKLTLADPKPLLSHYQLYIEQLKSRLTSTIKQQLNDQCQQLRSIEFRLQKHHPSRTLSEYILKNDSLAKRLNKSIQVIIKDKSTQFAHCVKQLNTVSPLATLERGYSITLSDDALVTSAADISIESHITTRLIDGELTSRVIEKKMFYT